MSNSSPSLTPRMVADFCRKRLSALLPPLEVDRLQQYMLELLASALLPPIVRGAPDWCEISAITDIDCDVLRSIGSAVQPAFDAIERTVTRRQARRERGRVSLRTTSGRRDPPRSV